MWADAAGLGQFGALAPGSLRAIRSYSIRAPWLDIRDLEQEAAAASLEAARGWRAGEAPPELWESRLVAIALSRLVAEQRSPVSVPDCRGKEGSRDRANWELAAYAGRAPLTVPGDDGGEIEHPEVARRAAEAWEPIEDQLDRARALAVAVALLEARSEAARAVVLGDEKPAEVAARLGLSRAEVYDEAARAMKALRKVLGVAHEKARQSEAAR